MTTEFAASNGHKIVRQHDDRLAIFDPRGTIDRGVRASLTAALREYFTAERDTELGRWRDEETGFLIYPASPMLIAPHTRYRSVYVLDEHGFPRSIHVHEGDAKDHENRDRPAFQAAARYFDAHPEPKPWESAEEGEMWLITCGTVYKNAPAIVKDGSFYFPNRYGDGMDFIDLEGVMTATRIWPTEESDDE